MKMKLPAVVIKTTAMARPKGFRVNEEGKDDRRIWTGKQLAQAIRAIKGPIYASISGHNDYIEIQIVKSDLLAWALEQGDDNIDFAITKKGNNYYFDKNYYAAEDY